MIQKLVKIRVIRGQKMKTISILALLLVCSGAIAQSDFVRGNKVVFEISLFCSVSLLWVSWRIWKFPF